MLTPHGLIEVKFNTEPSHRSELVEMKIGSVYYDRFSKGYAPESKAAPLDDLIRIACSVMDITVEQFKSRERTQEMSWARRLVACYQLINTQFTLKNIGMQTGFRDHCSALHDKMRHNDWYLFDPEYTNRVEAFITGIKRLHMGYSSHMKFPLK